MSVYRIASGFRSMVAHHPREFAYHLRGFGLIQPIRVDQPIRIIQLIRTQKYSTDESSSEPDDFANRVTKLEKFLSTTMEGGLQKVKDELKEEVKGELTMSLEKSLKKSLGESLGESLERSLEKSLGERLERNLGEGLERRLEKGLAMTNDGIEDLRAWLRWIMGTFYVGIMLKVVLYDRYVEEKMEEKMEKKLGEMETRLTTMTHYAITQLKLELMVENQQRQSG